MRDHPSLRETPVPAPLRPGERRIGLDLVRSIAIILVLISHCGDIFSAWAGRRFPPLLSACGFLGVALFFALSGFLIGRILIEAVERGAGARAWASFMARRWMRTLPLYYLWLIVLAILWRPYFWEPGTARLWIDLPWFATLTQNLAWPMRDNWFGVSWSLAVEEWFYLLAAALMIALARAVGARPAVLLTCLIFSVVPLWLRWQMPADTDWNEVTSKMVLLRLDAPACGILVAAIAAWRPNLLRHSTILAAIGIAFVLAVWDGRVFALLGASARVRNSFIFDVISIGFALCLPAAAAMTRGLGWLTVPVRMISAQSYAIYLMHLSILEMVGYYRTPLGLGIPASIALVIGLVLGLSFLSWRYFEQPILARRPRQITGDGRRPALADIGAAS